MLDFRLHKEYDAKHEVGRMIREGIPRDVPKLEQVGCFWAPEVLQEKQKARLNELLPYLTTMRLEKIVIPIISVQSTIRSLRALEWLVINYAKKLKITLVMKNGFVLNIYNDYRSRLRHWGRDMFDVNRRGQRIYLDFKHATYSTTYSTTVAQLNFLHWCEETGVLQYMKDNLADIETDMTQSINRSRQKKADLVAQGFKKRRLELSETKPLKCHILSIPLHFDFNTCIGSTI